MPIRFDAKRWEHVRRAHALWWDGKLGRPLINLHIDDYDAGRPEPALRSRGFTSYYELSVPADDVVDRWDYSLSTQRFVGDSFPTIWPNFGPGVLAGFLGGELKNGEPPYETTWFQPREFREIRDLSFRYLPGDAWAERIKDLVRAAGRRWGQLVQVGMTDLGGALDVLSSFRPGEQLLLDLYDHPAEVDRLAWQIHELWWKYFEEMDGELRRVSPGYTAWTPIFSETPYYMLQCDFCYMIGPDMFDRFVKPELAATCRRLKHAFYHLDGPGQLPHLDSLLTIPELKGVQWVPGAGQKPISAWPEVYRKIHKAGKLIQIFDRQDPLGPAVLDTIAGFIGTAEPIVLIGGADRASEQEILRLCEKYGAPAD